MKTVNDDIIKLELQSPWVTYYNKVKALLGNDTDLTIGNLEKGDLLQYIVKVDSTNTDKIIALQKIFKKYILLGNINLKIDFGVVNSDDDDDQVTAEDFRVAFNDNPIVESVEEVELFGIKYIYVIFKKKVIQFYNDDISDFYGNYNGLAEDIARELFNETGAFYCTSVK